MAETKKVEVKEEKTISQINTESNQNLLHTGPRKVVAESEGHDRQNTVAGIHAGKHPKFAPHPEPPKEKK